ncbi:MAG TPA: hypothetical protein VGK59_17250 [Ohtaekwangia sp.]
MDTKGLMDTLQQLKDQHTQVFFSVDKGSDERDATVFIEANRNGILAFCDFLLRSIEKSHLEKDAIYRIPDEFKDDSKVCIAYIRIAEGNQNPKPVNESKLTQLCCAAVMISGVVIFLIGIISTIQFLAKLF